MASLEQSLRTLAGQVFSVLAQFDGLWTGAWPWQVLHTSLEMHKKVLIEVTSDRDNYGDVTSLTLLACCYLRSRGHSQGRIVIPHYHSFTPVEFDCGNSESSGNSLSFLGDAGSPVFTVDHFPMCTKAAIQVSRAPHPAVRWYNLGIWIHQSAFLLILYC